MTDIFNVAYTVFILISGIFTGLLAFLITSLIIYKGIDYILERVTNEGN